MERRVGLLLLLLLTGCLSPPVWPDAGPIILSGPNPPAPVVVPPSTAWSVPPLVGPTQVGPPLVPIPGWPGTVPVAPIVPIVPVVVPLPPPLLPFFRQREDWREVVVFDPATRALLRPSSLNLPFAITAVTVRDDLALTNRAPGGLQLMELATETVDGLVELRDVDPDGRACLSANRTVIAYTAREGDRRRVQLFDRLLRVMNPLSRLNATGDAFDPALDAVGRTIAYVTGVDRRTDIRCYDPLTGLVDPMPGVNTPEAESSPWLSDSGQWLAFITVEQGRPVARLYDRLTGGLDTLPALNGLGPITRIWISPDGTFLLVVVAKDGTEQVAAYSRPTGFIDPLPEVNQAGYSVSF
jgi:hypothetical protein